MAVFGDGEFDVSDSKDSAELDVSDQINGNGELNVTEQIRAMASLMSLTQLIALSLMSLIKC